MGGGVTLNLSVVGTEGNGVWEGVPIRRKCLHFIFKIVSSCAYGIFYHKCSAEQIDKVGELKLLIILGGVLTPKTPPGSGLGNLYKQ